MFKLFVTVMLILILYNSCSILGYLTGHSLKLGGECGIDVRRLPSNESYPLEPKESEILEGE